MKQGEMDPILYGLMVVSVHTDHFFLVNLQVEVSKIVVSSMMMVIGMTVNVHPDTHATSVRRQVNSKIRDEYKYLFLKEQSDYSLVSGGLPNRQISSA